MTGSSGRPAGRWGLGRWLQLAGFLLFLSTFASFALHFGDFTDFEGRARSNMLRAVLGMALLAVGGFVQAGSNRRRAASGWPEVDDGWPRSASRQDASPSESPPSPPPSAPRQVVKVRCSYCGGLNDEHATVCEHCKARF